MSIHRSGHTSTPFITPNNTSGIQYHGGSGKIAPEITSATTKRLFAPVSLSHPQQSPTELHYTYSQPPLQSDYTVTDGDLHQYLPLAREHSISTTISSIQLPPFLYQYITQQLYQMYDLESTSTTTLNQNSTDSTTHTTTQPQIDSTQTLHGLETIFTVTFGGRQSPTVVLSDLWVHSRAGNIWLHIIPPNSFQFTQHSSQSHISSTTTRGALESTNQQSTDETNQCNVERDLTTHQSILFSLPIPHQTNQSTINNPQQTQNQPSKFHHFLSVNNNTYLISFSNQSTSTILSSSSTTTHTSVPISSVKVIDELPSIIIHQLLSLDDLQIYINSPNQHYTQTNTNPFSSCLTCSTTTDIINTNSNSHSSSTTTPVTTPSPSNTTAQTTSQTTTHSTHSTSPLPRYKAAATSYQSTIFIHGGRSGFAQNYDKKTKSGLYNPNEQKKKVNQFFSFSTRDYTDDDFTTLLRDESVMVECILPLTPPKNNFNNNENNTTAISSPTTNNSPISQQPIEYTTHNQQDALSNDNHDPTFVSLLLNDLWILQLHSFPFKWTRIDQLYTQNGQVLPTHRFCHAATIISNEQQFNIGDISNTHNNQIVSKYLVLHGGLRLNHDVPNFQQHTKFTTSTSTSSYHKALISSPTLFILNITSFLHNFMSSSPNIDYSTIQSIFTTPPLMLDRPHHTDQSDQFILPPSIQIGERPFDLYGHQLISLTFQQNDENINNNQHNRQSISNDPIVSLIAIGGTSHTCLAAASIMAMDINMKQIDAIFHNSQSPPTHLTTPNTNQDANNSLHTSLQSQLHLIWSPIHKPIDDALFIRHTANALPIQPVMTQDHIDTNTLSTLNNNQTQNTQDEQDGDNNNKLNQVDNCVNNNSCDTKSVVLLGGGALCFSFGTYYSPTYHLLVKKHRHREVQNQQQPYSQFTTLSTCLKPLELVSLMTSNDWISPQQYSQQLQLQIQLNSSSTRSINVNKQLNKQRQLLQQQKKTRDNHTIVDTSKNIKGVSQTCVICGEEFDSKNKLFKHITITGHKKVEE